MKLIPQQKEAINFRELFTVGNYLSVNKKLLQQYGPNVAVYYGNLVDRLGYFVRSCAINGEQPRLNKDGSFFLTYAEQTQTTGMSEYRLRKCKNILKKANFLKTNIRGLPAKEWYYILYGDNKEAGNGKN